MNKIVITDLSYVLLFPKDKAYTSGLNDLNSQLLTKDANYNFFNYFELNQELLDFYAEVNKTHPVYIFTSESIQNHPAIRKLLEDSLSGIYSAGHMNVSKKEASSYKKLLLDTKADDVLFIDDNQPNLDAASLAGLKTALYESNEGAIEAIGNYIGASTTK